MRTANPAAVSILNLPPPNTHPRYTAGKTKKKKRKSSVCPAGIQQPAHPQGAGQGRQALRALHLPADLGFEVCLRNQRLSLSLSLSICRTIGKPSTPARGAKSPCQAASASERTQSHQISVHGRRPRSRPPCAPCACAACPAPPATWQGPRGGGSRCSPPEALRASAGSRAPRVDFA